MEKNPCYKDMDPVYEEVDLKGRSENSTARRNKTNTRQEQDKVSTINKTKKKSKRFGKTLSVCVSLLALSLVAVIVLASYSYLEIQRIKFEADTFQEQIVNDSSHEVASLMTMIRQLEQELKRNKAQIHQLQQSQDRKFEQLRDNTTAKLNSLQSSVDTTTTQLSSLQSSVDTTTTQLSSLQSSVDTTTTQLSSLQSSVDTLTTRVNSPVNLYQKCIQEIRRCTFRASSFWGNCATPRLAVNSTGYYTNDMRCEYQSNHNYFQSTNIHKDNHMVFCRCDVIWPTPTSGHYNLPSSLTSTCSLIVTRCPLRFKLS